MRVTLLVTVLLCATAHLTLAKRVHYALNAGGPAHTTSTGVTFAADTDDTTNAFPRGISAVVSYNIGRVPAADQILYRTERYALTTFGYNIPKPPNGDYTLVLRFAEVYFRQPDQKVFDIRVNKEHTVAKNFDIFAEAGFSSAHDLHIPLTFKGDKLTIEGATSTVADEFRVEFVKALADNPKICALALIKGSPSDAGELLPLQEIVHDEDVLEDDEDEDAEKSAPTPPPPVQKSRKLKEKLVNQKRKVDPYEDSSEFPIIPVFLALVAIVAVRQAYLMLTK